eukprot:6474083-Amphidinium_carterae.1
MDALVANSGKVISNNPAYCAEHSKIYRNIAQNAAWPTRQNARYKGGALDASALACGTLRI